MFTMLGSEWVMWLLLLLSIISVAFIIDRLRVLRNQERIGARLWTDKIDAFLAPGANKGGFDASDVAVNYPCLEGRLVDLIKSKNEDRESMELLVRSFIGREKLVLEKNLAFLGTVGSNAPFIGLFGTVLGIIKAFHDLGSSMASGGAQSVSVGLSEALIATAVGLFVAIPAVIFFNYFQRKIKMITGRAESLANFMISLIK